MAFAPTAQAKPSGKSQRAVSDNAPRELSDNKTDFLRILTDFGCRLADFINFPDHHAFSVNDVETILRTAKKYQVKFLVTTEKDRVKLPKNIFSTMKIYSIGIRISFIEHDEDRFREFIYNSVTST